MGKAIYTKAELAALVDAPAIVEKADGQLDLAIDKAWHSLRLAEQRETQTAEKAEAAQGVARKAGEEARRHRVELGKLLIAKKDGTKHGKWLPYLEKLGIESQRASEWMRLAGYQESKSPTFENDGNFDDAPTLRDAGIDKRPRKSEAANENAQTAEPEPVVRVGQATPARPVGRSGGRGKPSWLMRALVRDYTLTSDLVCDPLAGWGSTLRAALDEGRRAVGAEIDPKIVAEAGTLPIVAGDWRTALEHIDSVDAVITDPPYSERTHAASRKFGNAREDGSPLDGLGPEYAAWTRDHVFEFVRSWSPRCCGWMIALTDHNLIHDWQDAYEEAGRYAFAPVVCVIRGMTVRLCGDGPSSWAIYAMVARPREMSRWRTTPGGYVGTRDRLEIEGDS